MHTCEAYFVANISPDSSTKGKDDIIKLEHIRPNYQKIRPESRRLESFEQRNLDVTGAARKNQNTEEKPPVQYTEDKSNTFVLKTNES